MSSNGAGSRRTDSESDPVLSQQQIDEFHERGLLRVDFGFSKSLLRAIVREVHGLYSEEFHQGLIARTRAQDAWKQLPEVRQLAIDRRVLLALEQLMGRKPLPFQTLNFPIGTAQLTHSDTIHFSTIPEGYMAGIWVALEDIDSNNGPLIYYPGSHKLPYLKMHDLDLEPGSENYPAYVQATQRLILEHDLKPEYGEINKGEAIIWHANLLHGGAPQHDMRRSRHSQVTHYYFEGCQYYTPMLSSPTDFKFRNPVWIPLHDEEYTPLDFDRKTGLIRSLMQRLKS